MPQAAGKQRFRKRDRDSDDSDDGVNLVAIKEVTMKKGSSSSGLVKPEPSDKAVTMSALAYTVPTNAGSSEQGGSAFPRSEIDGDPTYDVIKRLKEKISNHDNIIAEIESGKKLYRGSTGYTDYIKRDVDEAVAQAKSKGVIGPAKAPSNVRQITRMDYQPDVCKDFKETGYCGFGDSCIFLHDRGDYKSSWQIEKDWDAEQKKKQDLRARAMRLGKSVEELEEEEKKSAKDPNAIKYDEDDLPFACHICRQSFLDPVVTLCNHYFCEKCARDRYSKDSTCAICKKPTNGVFNNAEKLRLKLSEKGLLRADSKPDTIHEPSGGWEVM